MPADLSRQDLIDTLRRHPHLQPPGGNAVEHADESIVGNGACVHTLASDLRRDLQVATIRFEHLPATLRTLGRCQAFTIDAHRAQGRNTLPPLRLTIDQHFHGLTVLHSPLPSNHDVDVLAVPGLGGHSFGSFVHKDDGHMWLSDSLPKDIPTARVMIYGYDSGLQDSTCFAGLDDLAGSLYRETARLSRTSGPKPLILIGHSLGGLLIKEVLILWTEDAQESDEFKQVVGLLFFGVPNDGMDIGSLIPIVNDQPNRFLLESLNAINSQILRLQKRSFARLMDEMALELFCFYETRLSPTAKQVSNPNIQHDWC